jgi:flavin-dependent dehydrogenase
MMTRRDFLRRTIGAAAFGAAAREPDVAYQSSRSDAKGKAMRDAVAVQSSHEIPLIFEVEVLAIGGGLAGVAAAAEIAEPGRRVALVEAETSLGYEFGAWQRPWVTWRQAHRNLLCDWLPVEHLANAAADGDHVPLHMDRLKIKLEDRLLERGVELLYASRPVGCRKEGGRWLVIFGNKCGRQAVAARYLIDATENGIMAYLGGQAAAPDTTVTRRTVEFTGVRQQGIQQIGVPQSLGIAGDSVTVYPGGFSDTHVYIDVPVIFDPPVPRSPAGDTDVELCARRKSLEIARYLTHNVPAFAQAKLGLGSLQVMRGDGFDPVDALEHGSALARALLADELNGNDCHFVSGAGRRSVGLADAPPTPKGAAIALAYKEHSDFAASWPGEFVSAPVGPLPVLAEVEVAVIGGGTSGAPAAYVAAREGVSVAVVEMNSRLGGTGTVGGIKAHWMSSPNAFNDEIDRRVEQWEDAVSYPPEARTWTTQRTRQDGTRYVWGGDAEWSIEVKEQVLEEMCREAGVALCLNSLHCGTLVEGDRVLGVLAATPYGPRAVLGEITVDATGDGDVAAFAGAEHVYGNARDRLTQWTAIAFYREPGSLGNNHLEAGDIGDIFDYTRFILTNRRRGGNLHDHGNYVAPRESRHILGEVINTLTDQLLLARYPDTVAVLFSNWDMKGLWFADIVDFGINPPHEEIEVPYRALIPKRLQQIIIAGKAFSLTHDACAAPRMQRDLILLGGAVGLAAALAVKDGVSPRKLDVTNLQRRMVETGNMPARMLDYAPPTPPDLAALVGGLTGEEPLEWQEMLASEKATSVSPVIQLCCADSATVVPLLRRASDVSEGKRRLLLGRLLLWHRCDEGADVVYREVRRQLDDCDGLPQRVGEIFWSTNSPEQGIQPEIIFLVNALVRVKDKRLPGLLSQFVERIVRATRDYRDTKAGIFDHIRMVAMAAERIASPEFVPMLRQLLNLPEIRQAAARQGLALDHMTERRTYLVLALARSLARCGQKDGLMTLAELVGDSRSLYARSALLELRAITGLDHPLSRERWLAALQSWPETFPGAPWEKEVA